MSMFAEMASAPKPKDLDEEEQDDNNGGADVSGSPKEFFWDRLVLLLSSAIVALTALDIVTELLRGGSAVVCYPPGDLNLSDAQGQYVNTFCAQRLPATQYFPVFVFVHGALIAVCHYFWRSSHRVQIDYFFKTATELSRLPDEKTGNYPPKNYTIIRKLESEFSTFSERGLLRTYRLKLLLQALVGGASLAATSVVFTEFDVTFECPNPYIRGGGGVGGAVEDREGINGDPFWPLKGTKVQCIFSSLRLFALVHIADVLLLVLILLVLTCGLAWTYLRQDAELGHRRVALFSLESGTGPHFYRPKPWLPGWAGRGGVAGLLAEIRDAGGLTGAVRSGFLSPRMETDLDLLLVLLYRSDAGLGHAFKEGQVHRELQRLVESELQTLNLHIRMDGNSSQLLAVEGNEDERDAHLIASVALKWQFSENVYLSFQTLPLDQCLYIPNTIQGAVLGFGLRAPNNDRAVDVLFGSSGFTSALARAFSEAAFIQFDPLYKDAEKPVVSLTFPVNITGYRCQENILSHEAGSLNQFVENTEEIWSYCGQPNHYKTAFMVIGPISRATQVTTARLLVEQLKFKFQEKAILLTVRPLKVEGKKTAKQFYKFVPPKDLFSPLVHEVEVTPTSSLPWPASLASRDLEAGGAVGCCVSTNSVFRLKCGLTNCEYELIAYQFLSSNSTEGCRVINNAETQLETLSTSECYRRPQSGGDFVAACLNVITTSTANGENSTAENSSNGHNGQGQATRALV